MKNALERRIAEAESNLLRVFIGTLFVDLAKNWYENRNKDDIINIQLAASNG
jgi:hypothetical protein